MDTAPSYCPCSAYLASVASLAGAHQSLWSRYHWMVSSSPSEKSRWTGSQPSSSQVLAGSMA
nr:hypothetical protein [Olsenella sp. CU969]